MKELSIEEKAKRYDKSFKRASNIHKDAVEMDNGMLTKTCEIIFPELAESEYERIRKVLIGWINLEPSTSFNDTFDGFSKEQILAWIEKKDNTNEIINRDEFAQGVLRGAAINLITWIDYNSAKGNMCLSNMECKDIEDALVHADWDKIYAYLKKKLEKQVDTNIFDVPKISIKDAVEVTSRMQYIDGDMKPIAEFIMDYAHWDLHKDEWNHPTLTVPLFRVLDALIQRGKLYCGCNQNIEKQCEQKPSDKIEPKFKVGDWTVSKLDKKARQISEVHFDEYNSYYVVNGKSVNLEEYDRLHHLWTIQDAKDGDVLYDGNVACIFRKTMEDDDIWIDAYCGINIDNEFKVNDVDECWCLSENCSPATKEQRDLLFQKMKEAGYKLDEKFNVVKI